MHVAFTAGQPLTLLPALMQEDRYTREPNSFDWYLGYRGLAQLLHAHIGLSAAILQIGVGSSRLQVRLNGMDPGRQAREIWVAELDAWVATRVEARWPVGVGACPSACPWCSCVD
jgi:hypothetical protein